MSIDWQSTLAQLDADPEIGAPNGQAVLKGLVEAGRAYDSAGKPDVLFESDAHRRWSSLLPSQRLGQVEPPFYLASFYTRLGSLLSSGTSALLHRTFSSEDLKALPKEALSAYRFWLPKDGAIARRIASYYIAKSEEAERESAAARSPTLGQVESNLISALGAAQTFLAA